MIAGKILNCRTLLRRNGRGDLSGTIEGLKRLADQAKRTDNFASLLGVEGTAARMYFCAFPAMIADTAADFAGEFSQLGATAGRRAIL